MFFPSSRISHSVKDQKRGQLLNARQSFHVCLHELNRYLVINNTLNHQY